MKDFIKKHPYLTTFIVLMILFTIRYIFMTFLVKKEVANQIAKNTNPNTDKDDNFTNWGAGTGGVTEEPTDNEGVNYANVHPTFW